MIKIIANGINKEIRRIDMVSSWVIMIILILDLSVTVWLLISKKRLIKVVASEIIEAIKKNME